jgi:hypothetical protein
LPTTFGDWGVDYSEVRTSTLGITPRSGASMLRFVSTNFSVTGGMCGPSNMGASADVAQLVDVSRCTAGTTLELSAYVTATAGASPGTATCTLRSYTGTTAAFGMVTETASQDATIALDTSPTTWQRCDATLALPAGTAFVAAYLSAGTSARARFADDASLKISSGACP